MDFSSLDLLASTALRDNNQSADDSSTPTEVHHLQHNHHSSAENEEEDDETDGKKHLTDISESGSAVTSESESASVSESQSVCVVEIFPEGDMGSVKCGKPKKTSVKSVSIYVRDGKCVAKQVSTGTTTGANCNSETGGQVTGHSNMTVPEKVNSVISPRELCKSNSTEDEEQLPLDTTRTESEREILVKPEIGKQICNGIKTVVLAKSKESSEHVAAVQDVDVAAISCDSAPKAAFCDSRIWPLPEDSEDLTDQTKSQSDEKESCSEASFSAETAAVHEPVLKLDSVASDSDQIQAEVKGISEAGKSVCANSEVDPMLTGIPDAAEIPSGVLQSTRETPVHPESLLQDLTESDRGGNIQDSNKFASYTIQTTKCEDSTDLPSTSCTSMVGDEQNAPSSDVVTQNSSKNKDLSLSSGSVDTMLSPPPPPPPPLQAVATYAVIAADHNYCARSKQRQSLENTDDSGDAFESADENVSADEIERRPRSLSVDSVYLQHGGPGLPPQQEGLLQNDKYALLSPTLSVDSISNDSSLSENSAVAGGQCYSILVGSNPSRTLSQCPGNSDSQGGVNSLVAGFEEGRLHLNQHETPVSSNLLTDSNSVMGVGPKCGKFRIGTFGSFSNSHLDLEKDVKKSKLKIGLSSEPVMKTALSSAVASPGSPFPLLQSPGLEWDRSDAGSEGPDEMDSSTTEDKFLSSSHDSEAFDNQVSQVWNHPVFHDHDYCCKEVSEEYLGKPAAPTPLTKGGKRKYVKKKDRQEFEEEKLKKGKYLKRELLKRDNRFNLSGNSGNSSGVDSRPVSARSSLLAESLISKPNPVGRPRKRKDKQEEEYDAETGTKMKITGRYRDQYVYYLNKSSRNRRRKLDEKLPQGDKIILPAPKPGDIVVPHLTDADCEAIRYGGRMALNVSPLPTGPAPLPQADSGDMDSSIVNTILSMETEHGNLASPLASYEDDGDNADFEDFEGNLTSEQVKVLFDCLDTYHMEETTTSQDLDLLTSAEAISVPTTAVNSLAATTVEDDFLVPGAQSSLGVMGLASSGLLGDKTDTCRTAEGVLGTETGPSLLKPNSVSTNTTPVVSSSSLGVPTSQPSVEKNLEFLKTPFTRSDFFPAVSSVSSTGSSTDFVPASTAGLGSAKSEEANETPWIVTVTLYWNDIPAIVINNMPHVRLVDIHRQILPAKDTGILKKRCQLMNIHVSNCSEMQRYFLVQYGRAHNSKSTLVISKDEAQRLISYYVHPPPRNLRGEEGAGLRRSSSYAELRSIMERPNSSGRHSNLALAQPRKRGGFRRRALPSRSHNPSPEPLATSATPEVGASSLPPPYSAPPVKGLRHKKINFREMLKGEDSSPLASDGVEGVTEDSPAPPYVASSGKGRGGKGTGGAGRVKRRGIREGEGGSPAKRGRKEWRKRETGKESVQALSVEETEPVIMVDGDTPDTSTTTVKSKKRSPGSSANGSLGTSSRSPKSRFGPIKVNVKSLVHSGGSVSGDVRVPRKKNLFGRKSSTTDAVVNVAEEAPLSHPLRVLRISHQDAEADSSSRLEVLSPMAEVHLDLYKRASSPCVKCRTCEKFLSVPGFLKHQHVNGGGDNNNGSAPQDVVHNHQRRMLVPMNKENISLEEQHLWNEFVALQESLDHSISVVSMGAYPLTPLSPQSLVGSSMDDMYGETLTSAVDEARLTTSEPLSQHHQGIDHLHNVHDGLTHLSESEALSVRGARYVMSADNGACAYSDVVNVDDSMPTSGEDSHSVEPHISVCSPPPHPLTHTNSEEKFLDISDVDKKEIPSPPQIVVPSKKQPAMQRTRKNTPPTNIRTSSRKRETKRLYSFEKYDFGGGGRKNSRGEVDVTDVMDESQETLPEDDIKSLVLCSPTFQLAPESSFQESSNV